MDKKKMQLGMNSSTAAHRLRMDLLFHFAVKDGHVCFQCGNDLTRDSFSVEHKVPWLDSPNPVALFFDLNNIAFSHVKCNSSAARRPRTLDLNTLPHGLYSRYQKGCRCRLCNLANAEKQRSDYDPEKRHKRYKLTGY